MIALCEYLTNCTHRPYVEQHTPIFGHYLILAIEKYSKKLFIRNSSSLPIYIDFIRFDYLTTLHLYIII